MCLEDKLELLFGEAGEGATGDKLFSLWDGEFRWLSECAAPFAAVSFMYGC